MLPPETSPPEPCTLLPWDTQFWGIPIARVNRDTLTAEELADVQRWCEEHGIACAYFLASSEDPRTIRVAEDGGFVAMDIRVMVVRDLRTPLDTSELDGFVIRDPQAEDEDEIVALARSSYRFTRFYNDPRFPDDRCDDLYESWIREHLAGAADKVFVIEDGGALAGYMTCHLTSESGHARLALTAVHGERRRSGMGRALVVAAMSWLRDRGATSVVGYTAGRNVAMQRVLQREGFVTERTEIWYHKWYR